MEEIASQFYEELQELLDRYKNFMSVPHIMHISQDVFHKTLSIKYHPELHSKEMAEKYAKEISSVTIEQAYFAGLKALNDIHNDNFTRAKENIEGIYEVTEAAEEFLRNGDTKCID